MILENSYPFEYQGVDMLKQCYVLDNNDTIVGEEKYYKLKAQNDIFNEIKVRFLFCLNWVCCGLMYLFYYRVWRLTGIT